MTSKNLYFKLMKEDAKRRLWAIALLALAFFFTFPVAAVFLAGDRDLSTTRLVMQWLSRGNGMVTVIIVTSAVVCGISSFSYLFSKRKVDFYHSIPVRREKLFAANFLNGILVVAVPYLVSLLLFVVIAGAYGVSVGPMLAEALQSWLYFMVYYLILYTTVVIAVIMTGSVIVSLMATFVFFAYGPTLLLIVNEYFQLWFRTYYDDGKIMALSSKLSPFMSFVDGFQSEVTAGFLLPRLAVGAVLTAIALFLYLRRPSEASGKAMAFKKSQSVIRVFLVILNAMVGNIFFWEMRSEMGWAIFGLLCGCVFSHCVIEIIYHYDFKKLFSHKIQMLACALFSLVIFLGFRYDWVGYDSYLPKEADVKSAAVSIDGIDQWISYGETEEVAAGEYLWNSVSKDEYIFENMRLTDVSDVVTIAGKGIERNISISEDEQYPSGRRYYGSDNNELYTSIAIEYHLKNGRTVKRVYYLPITPLTDELGRIYQQEEFKAGSIPILNEQPDNLAYVDLEELGEHDKLDVSKELLEAYQQDVKMMTLDQRIHDYPIATMFLATKADEMAIKSEAGREYNYYNRNYYPIYPTYTNTIDVMAKQGFDLGQPLEISQIIQVSIDNRKNYRDSNKNVGKQVTLTKPEDIKSIMPALEYSAYSRYFSFDSNERLDAEVTMGSDKKSRKMDYYLRKELVPADILDMIEYESTKELEEYENTYDKYD